MARKSRKYPQKDDEPQGPGEHSKPVVEIHNAVVARHTGAGPTAAAYQRARRQFQSLRGAVRMPATRAGNAVAPEPPQDGGKVPK